MKSEKYRDAPRARGGDILRPRNDNNRINKNPQPTPVQRAPVQAAPLRRGELPPNLKAWQELVIAHRQTYGELEPRRQAAQADHWTTQMGQLNIQECGDRASTPGRFMEE